jgi:hypothetical protein
MENRRKGKREDRIAGRCRAWLRREYKAIVQNAGGSRALGRGRRAVCRGASEHAKRQMRRGVGCRDKNIGDIGVRQRTTASSTAAIIAGRRQMIGSGEIRLPVIDNVVWGAERGIDLRNASGQRDRRGSAAGDRSAATDRCDVQYAMLDVKRGRQGNRIRIIDGQASDCRVEVVKCIQRTRYRVHRRIVEGADRQAYRFSPSALAICATANWPRTLLPASSSGGAKAAIASLPGATASTPPPTPLLAGRPTS